MSTEAPQTPAPPEPRSRAKWIVGGALILLGIGGLSAWAFASPGAVSYFTTPSELEVQAASAPADRTFRLGGRVASLERAGGTVDFTVTDGQSEVPVSYDGEIPDTLKEETDVIAEGTLSSDGTLVASRVLAKCSSKFEDVEDVDEHPERS